MNLFGATSDDPFARIILPPGDGIYRPVPVWYGPFYFIFHRYYKNLQKSSKKVLTYSKKCAILMNS